MYRFLPPSSSIFNSNYVGRVYINLPNGDAQPEVKQLDAIAAMDVCGIATAWIGQIQKCTRCGKGGTTNRGNRSAKEIFHSRCQGSKDPHELGDAEMIHILYSSSSGSVMLHNNHGRLHRSCTIKSAADNPDICWMVREIMETLSSNSMSMNRGPSELESR